MSAPPSRRAYALDGRIAPEAGPDERRRPPACAAGVPPDPRPRWHGARAGRTDQTRAHRGGVRRAELTTAAGPRRTGRLAPGASPAASGTGPLADVLDARGNSGPEN